jgi:hypothetical protein
MKKRTVGNIESFNQWLVSYVIPSYGGNALLTGRMWIEFFLLLLLLWHVFKTHMIKGRNVTKGKLVSAEEAF